MAPSRVTDSDSLAILKRMDQKRLHIRAVRAKFGAGQHVRISKERIKFAKGGDQNFSTEIFRIAKIRDRRP